MAQIPPHHGAGGAAGYMPHGPHPSVAHGHGHGGPVAAFPNGMTGMALPPVMVDAYGNPIPQQMYFTQAGGAAPVAMPMMPMNMAMSMGTLQRLG